MDEATTAEMARQKTSECQSRLNKIHYIYIRSTYEDSSFYLKIITNKLEPLHCCLALSPMYYFIAYDKHISTSTFMQ